MKNFKVITVILLTLFLLLNNSNTSYAKENKNYFEDVSREAYYFDALNSLVEKKIISTSSKLFHPDNSINKAESLKILLNLKDLKPEKISDFWEKDYLSLGEKNGVIKSVEDYKVESKKPVTRAESCKMILQTFGVQITNLDASFSDLHNFTDIDKNSWHANCVGFSAFYNLFKFEETNFLPNKEITRSEFMYFANETFIFSDSGKLKNILPEEREENSKLEIPNPKVDIETNPSIIPEEYQEKFDLLKEGTASYYGKSFTGRSTSSGRIFDNDKLMAAHPLLPFGSIVKVININNPEKFTEVEIVDCGPFSKGRVIDLSMAAFEKIVPLSAGIAGVKLEVAKIGEGKWQDKCFDLYKERALPVS